ncbi:MAG: hypothetical protein ABIJ18_01855 [archaeon]
MLKEGLNKIVKPGLGVIFLVFGGYSLYLLITKVDAWYTSPFFYEAILIIAGILLLRNVVIKFRDLEWKERAIDTIIALALTLFGLFPLGVELGLFTFLPFAVEFSNQTWLFPIIILAFGLYLVVDQIVKIFGKKY